MNFDTWEAGILPDEDVLMHWGIPGMKHGRNRYQNPDGTWTEEGLARRRQREGFGESRKERRLTKKVERAEKREARKAARAEAKAARAEKRRLNSVSGLTDEELQAKLKRARMESEYRELTKKGTVLETGANLVTKILDYKENKEKRVVELNKQKIDMMRAEAELVKAKTGVRRAKEETKKAIEERKKKEADVRGGLKTERKKDYLAKKTEYRNTTIRGGIGKRINQYLTAGKAEGYKAMRKAESDVAVNRYKSEQQKKDNDRKAREAKKAADKAARDAERAAEKERRRKERLYKQYGMGGRLNF